MTLLKTVHTILFELLTFESPVSSNFEQFLTQLHPPQFSIAIRISCVYAWPGLVGRWSICMTLLKTVHTILFELLTFVSPVSSNFEQFLTQFHPPPQIFRYKKYSLSLCMTWVCTKAVYLHDTFQDSSYNSV